MEVQKSAFVKILNKPSSYIYIENNVTFNNLYCSPTLKILFINTGKYCKFLLFIKYQKKFAHFKWISQVEILAVLNTLLLLSEIKM